VDLQFLRRPCTTSSLSLFLGWHGHIEFLRDLQREAVEAGLWKQQVEGSLQQIHNKVRLCWRLASTWPNCTSAFAKPAAHNACSECSTAS
jgi:hypothetical protein